MEAKDKSFGFDFTGTFNKIDENKALQYTLDDGRTVEVTFNELENNRTEVTETFEPESQNPVDMQRDGWTLIINNFRDYAEKQ